MAQLGTDRHKSIVNQKIVSAAMKTGPFLHPSLRMPANIIVYSGTAAF
jgi:hypothetical protein